MELKNNKTLNLRDAVVEASNNFKSSIGKTFQVDEAQEVWNSVGHVIESILSQHKAVSVLGLGTFTLSEWSLNTGLGKPLIISQPVFVMSEKLVRSFQLHSVHPFISDTIPCYMLHHRTVEAVCKRKKKLVETCIIEVVQAFTRLLWQNRNVSLAFGKVGQLEVVNKQVKMLFEPELQDRVMENVRKGREIEHIVPPWSPEKILK